jgi:hypothetical protein
VSTIELEPKIVYTQEMSWMATNATEQRAAFVEDRRSGSTRTATPPAGSLRARQSRFDGFRARYNDERPHEALAGPVPAARWLDFCKRNTRPFGSGKERTDIAIRGRRRTATTTADAEP